MVVPRKPFQRGVQIVVTVGVLVAVVAGGGPSGTQPLNYRGMWNEFKRTFKKQYNAGQDDDRFVIFTANVDTIEAHNAKNLSYMLGINQFADLTVEEVVATHTGSLPPPDSSHSTEKVFRIFTANSSYTLELQEFADLSAQEFLDAYKGPPKATRQQKHDIVVAEPPQTVDWVAEGAVTAVKDQGSCGSCWTFSSTGALEGAYFLVSGELLSLSEGELVDCDYTDPSEKCGGSDVGNAFDYLRDHGGICSESDYPYNSGGGHWGKCQKGCQPVVTVGNHGVVPKNDENALMLAVAKQPVSVSVATIDSFMKYKSGIYSDPACEGKHTDHAVLVVGYGSDSGRQFWKVKNSWATTYGEEGYIRMVRGYNQCSIASSAKFPVGVRAAGDPPPPEGPHYGNPFDGCRDDERSMELGGGGLICSPKCGPGESCPQDRPSGVSATPLCAISSHHYCALYCKSSDECGQQECIGSFCRSRNDATLATAQGTPQELVV